MAIYVPLLLVSVAVWSLVVCVTILFAVVCGPDLIVEVRRLCAKPAPPVDLQAVRRLRDLNAAYGVGKGRRC